VRGRSREVERNPCRGSVDEPSSLAHRLSCRVRAASRGHPALALLILLLAFVALLSGCGSNAGAYAQDARSSYISARAVLVGVQEFPAQMESLLRSADSDALPARARGLIDDARGLLPVASSAFRTVNEKCELLKGEGSDEFDSYADMLMELVGLNEQVINAYSEFIGLSNSLLQGLPYDSNPQALMPILNYMDSTIQSIDELSELIRPLEEETEALYRQLTA
jgi:hypothetical protein